MHTRRPPTFTYPACRQPGTVVMGQGAVRDIADDPGLDQAVVFTSGREAVQRRAAASLARRGASLRDDRTLAKPAGEPTADMVWFGAEFVRLHRPAWVVAIGGGSVLDWARLSAAAACGLLPSVDPSRGVPAPRLCLVPTTCASGAEASGVAVMLVDGRKTPVPLPHLLAERVVLDPQFLEDLSREERHRSLADALSHGIEAFVSLVPNGLAKEAAVSAITLILENHERHLRGAVAERLLHASYLAGMAASNCSVGIVHAWAHTVASYGLSHGLANAIGLVPGIHVNAVTDAMCELGRRLHVNGGLVRSVEAVLAPAVTDADRAMIRGLLADGAVRAAIASRMLDDVCSRTNPRRVDDLAVGMFLDEVAERAV